ncbi:ABC transporter ATP-binding protein [Nitratifractor salsuginis]|uniref:ABC transporter related protein n=1 Tax=Nitratifractor salsuginis (strain DSM 16511 / JCM 12458 / E9I37-1) TaxID=749222 RepID=E6WXZ3_NITSE|nr:ATP-binding cassette domain-containing protein [Nitratifractor salsuginis]ADV46367.1 ABC transporter related protein [Nitratifractor salsuginis DSM 16511]
MRKEEETVLRIEGLSFAYPDSRQIYDGFSLELRRGECLGIVGPSGSGKSTLFELIAGNLKPQKGRIEHGRLGWIFQDPYSSFHPSYPIDRQIDEVATLPEDPRQVAALGLDRDLLGKYPHELSGGQLQRCSILRALRMDPDLLLCDEPTSALDNITQLETMKLLIKLLDRVGILLITHDMDLARWACDRIIDLSLLQESSERLGV